MFRPEFADAARDSLGLAESAMRGLKKFRACFESMASMRMPWSTGEKSRSFAVDVSGDVRGSEGYESRSPGMVVMFALCSAGAVDTESIGHKSSIAGWLLGSAVRRLSWIGRGLA